MNTPRRHRLRNKTEEEAAQAPLPKCVSSKADRPATVPLHVQKRDREPTEDYAQEARHFSEQSIARIRKQCVEQIEVAQSGRKADAALNLDLLMTEVRTTIWDDLVLSTTLRKIVAHAQQQVQSVPELTAATKPAPTDEAIRVTADGRCIYRGKKLLAKLTPDEARWVERCIEMFHRDGEYEYEQKEISFYVFGKATDRFSPSEIFRTHGQKLFFTLFEKGQVLGQVLKRSNVTFEKPDNA
jgi:hypothetical protein